MTRNSIGRRTFGVFGAVLAFGLTAGLGSAQPRGEATNGTSLLGTFKLTAGSCTPGGATGSYFRMIYPGGTLAAGKFFSNPDSSCTEKSYSPVSPGSAGGLRTGAYQTSPTPAFDSKGDAKVATIIKPAAFAAIDFGLATLPKGPTGVQSAPAPTIIATGSKLSGQVEALWAEWNKLYFNQGSPKPGGSTPGLTQPLSGTYNATTHAFVLTWASAISGGPFNGFTGYWHLAGIFSPR